MMSPGDKPSQGLAAESDAPRTNLLPASAVHEINNPLESLLNLLYLLGDEPSLSEKGRHYLVLAQEEVRRISQIAREALNHTKVLVIPQRRNLSELLTAVVDFYKPRLDSSRITVQSRYSCNRDIRVYAEQLRQLFSNLLLNAIEAMPQGGKIQVRVSPGHEWCGRERRGVCVTVADSGSGMADSLLQQISKHRPFTSKSDGHGMGLSVVQDIVKNHKGVLHVKSSTRPGRSGTVFSLFLPAT